MNERRTPVPLGSMNAQDQSTSAVAGKNIAIVGGGPGGLTLARLLQKSGAKVVVYERDQSRSARVQGSALDLHDGSGLAALEAAGLMEAFWANHRSDLDRLRITDASGMVLHDHVRRMSGAGKRPEIERGPLRDLLLDSLEPGTRALGLANWSRRRFRTRGCCYVSMEK